MPRSATFRKVRLARAAVRPLAAGASLLFMTVFLTGCLYTGGRTVRTVGPRISESAVRAIAPGVTTDEWLVATFGEPNNRVCTTDGSEILRYDCDTRTTEGSYVFMLFASPLSNLLEILRSKNAASISRPFCVSWRSAHRSGNREGDFASSRAEMAAIASMPLPVEACGERG